jgi:hypothetical protein
MTSQPTGSPAAWSLERLGPVLRVTVSRNAGTSDLEGLLKSVLIEIRDGASDIVLSGHGLERPSTAASGLVQLLFRHRRDLGISVTLVDTPLQQ